VAPETPSTLLGRTGELVDHGQNCVPGDTVPGLVRPKTYRGERGLYRVGRAQMHPMLRWKVGEGKQFLLVLRQAINGLGILGPETGEQTVIGLAGLFPGGSLQISCKAFLSLVCTDFGALVSTLEVLCTQQGC
jgi:hypothetical protein